MINIRQYKYTGDYTKSLMLIGWQTQTITRKSAPAIIQNGCQSTFAWNNFFLISNVSFIPYNNYVSFSWKKSMKTYQMKFRRNELNLEMKDFHDQILVNSCAELVQKTFQKTIIIQMCTEF